MDQLRQSISQFSSLMLRHTKAIKGMLNLSPVNAKFSKRSLKLWSSNLFLNHREGSIKSEKVNINNNIFQENSLSSLLFCLSLIPRTSERNKTKPGYNKFEKNLSYLFYMDELELDDKNDDELEGLLAVVKQFSSDFIILFEIK